MFKATNVTSTCVNGFICSTSEIVCVNTRLPERAKRIRLTLSFESPLTFLPYFTMYDLKVHAVWRHSKNTTKDEKLSAYFKTRSLLFDIFNFVRTDWEHLRFLGGKGNEIHFFATHRFVRCSQLQLEFTLFTCSPFISFCYLINDNKHAQCSECFDWTVC